MGAEIRPSSLMLGWIQAQSSEGLNLRRSAEGHADESWQRRATEALRAPSPIPLVGNVEDSSRQLLRWVILQESRIAQAS